VKVEVVLVVALLLVVVLLVGCQPAADTATKATIDPKSLPYLEGTELDYTKEGMNEGFKFNNPNVKGECGCGESFTTTT